MIIDQTADINASTLYRIVNLYGAPDYVKEASAEDIAGPENLEPEVFADTRRRRYPCITKAAVWTSAAYFYDRPPEITQQSRDIVENRLKKFARYFGIEQEVENLATQIKQAKETKPAELPDSVFALIIDIDGEKARHWPLTDSLRVKQAADEFAQQRRRIPYDLRKQAAQAILSAADKYGADIRRHRDWLDRTVGVGACTAQDAAALVLGRQELAKRAGASQEMIDLLGNVSDTIQNRPDRFHAGRYYEKVAQVIDSVDRSCRVVGQDDLPLPEDVLFTITEKTAADLSLELAACPTGKIYRTADLERTPLSVLRDNFGDDFASAVSIANARTSGEKLAAVLPTLPKPDAELFDALVAEAGVSPVGSQKSAFSMEQDWNKLRGEAAAPPPGSIWQGRFSPPPSRE